MHEPACEYVRRRLCEVIGARRWILAPSVTDAGNWVRPLRSLGASDLLVLDQGFRGSRTYSNAEARTVLIGGSASDVTGAIRDYDALLRHPSPALISALDAFDPAKSVRVIASTMLSLAEVAGRRCYGPRLETWAALEDKTTVDALWDKAGVRRAPSVVVAPREGEIQRAFSLLDEGSGVVVSGDNKVGINAGAEYVRAVRARADIGPSAEFFGPLCRVVRVMPFFRGVPCSIHGLVLPGDTVVLRPVELLVFHSPVDQRFHYLGNSTHWDPHPLDREAMRRVARRVGEILRSEVNYRGSFTVDGIMSVGGFMPTELNTRFGDALWTISRSIPELPLAVLDAAVREQEPVEWPAAELEELIVARADAHRQFSGWAGSRSARAIPSSAYFQGDDNGYRADASNRRGGIEVAVEASQVGTLVRFHPDEHHLPAGRAVGPRIAALVRSLDAALGTSLGRMEAAEPVR